MKKFVTKIIIFVIMLSGITALINIWYMNISAYNQENISNSSINKFENVPYDIEICNFGSSHGSNGFYYDNYQKQYTCFNFALPSQSLDYDYRILEYYKDHIHENALVFITVSYMSLYGVDEVLFDDFLSKNKRYYHFLTEDYIKEYDLKTDIFETRLPALVQYDQLISGLMGICEDPSEEWTRTANEIDMDKYVSEAYARHLVRNRIDEQGNRIINEEHIDSLYHIIDLCRELKARPILVTTPYLSEYTDIILENSPDFFNEFYGMVDNIAIEKEVPYFNYAFDSRFCKDYALFINADHLNKEGALKFVDILMEDMSDYLREQSSISMSLF